MNAIFPPLNMAILNGNISFAFQAIQKLYADLINLCYGVFCKFLGDFWECLGGNSFSQRSCKMKI